MPSAPANTPGPWADAELLATAAEFPGVGSDAELPDLDRFRAGVSRLVAKCRAAAIQAGADPADAATEPCVFLLEPAGPPESFVDRCSRAPMLDRGRERLEGRVWFVSHVVTVGRWMSATFDEDDGLFAFVTEDLALGATPAVLYDPRPPGPELRVYPNGLGDPEVVESLHIAQSDISIEEVFSRIDVLHRNQLVTPGSQSAGAKVWEDASKGRASARAEDVLSGLVAAGLQTAFPMCKVRVEQPGPSGRLDIEIEERILADPGAVKRHAILELKVLRGLNSRGTPASRRTVNKWINDGVVQAASYRDDKDALAAALCCFDMRREFSGHDCFSVVSKLALELDVRLRTWHLFQSSSDFRRHQAESGALARRAGLHA